MKFSLIIPVYNVKKYLNECMDSILSQCFQDFEVILIDDGSSDGSQFMCDIYASKFPNLIKVVHQKNSGPSHARNTGIKSTKGEYLFFIDSDDKLADKDVLLHISKQTQGNDIVAFSWIEFPDGGQPSNGYEYTYMNSMKQNYDTGVEYLNEALEVDSLYPWYVWRYVFNRAFWLNKNYLYTEGIMYEDVEILYRILLNAKGIGIIKDVGYLYRISRKGSIVTDVNINTYMDAIKVIAKNIKDVETLDNVPITLKKKLNNNFSCLYYAQIIQSSRIVNKDEQRKMWNYLNKYKWICQYTTERKQMIVKYLISFLGIETTSKLLGIRRKIKLSFNNMKN